MAPKKGGSGGGSGCPACTSRLDLSGRDWKDATTDAFFAIQILTIIVLLAGLVLATRFKGVVRRTGYSIAVSFALLFFILSITNTALSESVTKTTNLYYLTYIFQSLGWRVSEILSLAIILSTIADGILSVTLSKFKLIPVLILALLSTASYGMYVYETSLNIRFGSWYRRSYYGYNTKVEYARSRIEVTYIALIFIVSIYIAISSMFAYQKTRSKATLVMIVCVAFSLFVRSLVQLIDFAMYLNRTIVPYEVQYRLAWADNFVYAITAMGIFGGLALIGVMPPKGNIVSKQEIEVRHV